MRLDDLLETLTSYSPDADTDVVIRAYFFAAKAHDGQTRKSGEAYFVHPLAVAGILTEMEMDVETIATALLHDTLEDTLATPEELEGLFGADVCSLVEGVTKLSKLEYRSKEMAAAENFRKMMVAMSRDVRVILVKLADRLHNMRTLEHMRDDKRRRISTETMEIYCPLAARLGLRWLQVELENLCFMYLHPERFQEVNDCLNESQAERQEYIDSVVAELDERLGESGVQGQISGRMKHLWSIYRKMVRSKLEFNQLYDLLAFRVIVDDLSQCYAVLGFVHSFYRPVPERIKDYIAMPKANGYQSLHTTVIGPSGRRAEIQIRTHEMHRVAENGIAAHWQYKEGHLAKPEEVAKVARLKEIFSVAREIEDPDEFMEVVKIDLFSQDVYVFTPNGDVREFPKGATALDFAYQIHSEVGNTCVGAKVGGQMVPLRYEMKSGDTIEILTSKNQHPRRAWLDMVKTGRAVSRIRQYLRREEHETGRRIGKEMLEGELKRRGTSINALVKKGVLKAWMKDNGMKEVDRLFLQIAQGHLGLVATVRELLPEDEPEKSSEEPADGVFGRMMERLRKRNRNSPVLVSGEDGVLINYANCCNPLPGEAIAGFVTRGRGITVHRRTCRQLLSMDSNRRIPVAWTSEDDGDGSTHIGNIQIICVDRPGLLANISTMCTDLKVNIAKVSAKSLGDDKGEVDLQVVVSDVSELSGLIRRLEKIKGIITVNRVGAGGA